MMNLDGTKGCIVVLCGLPGSGKTSLAKELEFPPDFQPVIVHHICYDDFIPNNINFELSPASLDPEGKQNAKITWKKLRNSLVQCIENLVTSKHGCVQPISSQQSTPTTENEQSDIIMKFNKELDGKIYSFGLHGNLDKRSEEVSHLYIIDDNMFYRSMRYEFYQLARKCNIGFCQVYLHCSLETASERNLQRPEPIPYKTLVGMATKLEAPDAKKYPWETKSVVIDVMETRIDAREKVLDIIRQALTDPVAPLEMEDLAEKEAASQANAASIVHQSDQILRKCIADTMKTAKVSMDKMKLKELGKQLSSLKNEIFEDIKTGKIHFQVGNDVSNPNTSRKDWQQKLESQIVEVFNERLILLMSN